MRIGIDISQVAFEGTGVAAYVRNVTRALITRYPEHEYVLFGASLRKREVFSQYVRSLGNTSGNIRLVSLPIPPTILDLLWNRLHIVPVEWFTGRLDVFWSSDWTQPPLAHAKGVTTIHDLSVLKYGEESHDKTEFRWTQLAPIANIVETQKRRLKYAARECSAFFCDSASSKKDAVKLLGIKENTLIVVYPGFSR